MRIKKVPLILQMEVTECGAASLGMILGFYGKKVPMEQLRIDCGVSRDGVNAKNIAKAAAFHGLIPSAYYMEPEEVREIDFPAIIHWNMEHFVVLYGFDKKGAHIADPALGYVTVSEEAFSKSFTGIVMSFEVGENFEKDDGEKKSEGFIKSSVRPFTKALVFLGILLAVISVIDFYTPFFNSVYIDKILMSGSLENMMVMIVFMIISMLIVTAAVSVYLKMQFQMIRNMGISINSRFMWKIMSYPIEFFSQRNPGELSKRQEDNFNIADTLCSSFVSVIVNAAMILIYVIFFFTFDYTVGIIGIMSAGINIVSVAVSAKEIRNDMTLTQRDEGVLQGNISSAVNMIETVKACGCENGIFEKLSGMAAGSINTKNKIKRIGIYSQTVFSIINNLMYSSVLIIGIYKVLSGEFTAGMLIGTAGIMTAFLDPIKSAADSVEDIQNMNGSVMRIDDAMNYIHKPKFAEADEKNPSDSGIVIDGLCFKYNAYGENFIDDFSLEIKSGESTAFMGGSGSGKSTMAKLISGLYTPNDGRILYGGLEISEISEKCFYSRMAVVDQNIRLFDGTIFENITMWDKDILYEDVVRAAKDACIHDEIMSRNGGYFDRVFAGGKNFSGGQRQKIEIARALAKNPEILILDEATSALDAAAEAVIMQNIKIRGITLIIIAHRLSTIRDCDNILVMDNGNVTESGTHNELMALGGMYSRLTACG